MLVKYVDILHKFRIILPCELVFFSGARIQVLEVKINQMMETNTISHAIGKRNQNLIPKMINYLIYPEKNVPPYICFCSLQN